MLIIILYKTYNIIWYNINNVVYLVRGTHPIGRCAYVADWSPSEMIYIFRSVFFTIFRPRARNIKLFGRPPQPVHVAAVSWILHVAYAPVNLTGLRQSSREPRCSRKNASSTHVTYLEPVSSIIYIYMGVYAFFWFWIFSSFSQLTHWTDR